MGTPINKLADLQDFNVVSKSAIIDRLLKTKHVIDKTGLPYADHMQDNWLRLWEYSGAIIESRLDKRMVVLDAGGTGTIFSYYMAVEGCEVHTVDTWEEKVTDAKKLSEALGLPMYHSIQDIRDLVYKDAYFDAVYCICVIEHLAKATQVVGIRELARVLKPGGVLSFTFDYGKDAADFPILDEDEVVSRIAVPSGLEIIGNSEFHAISTDLGGTSLDYTFGSLFLRKPGQLRLRTERVASIGTPGLIDIAQDDDGFTGQYHYPKRRDHV